MRFIKPTKLKSIKFPLKLITKLNEKLNQITSAKVVLARTPVTLGQGHGQFQFSVSAQDGTVALGKAHMCSTPSLSSLLKVALKTVPIFG